MADGLRRAPNLYVNYYIQDTTRRHHTATKTRYKAEDRS